MGRSPPPGGRRPRPRAGRSQKTLQDRADDVRSQLPCPGDQPGGAALDLGVGQLQLDDRIGLFEDQDLFILGVHRLDEVPIQGIGHGHLEKIDLAQEPQFLQPVPGVGEGHPRGDDAGPGMGAVPGGERGGKLRRPGDLFDLVVELPVQFPANRGVAHQRRGFFSNRAGRSRRRGGPQGTFCRAWQTRVVGRSMTGSS